MNRFSPCLFTLRCKTAPVSPQIEGATPDRAQPSLGQGFLLACLLFVLGPIAFAQAHPAFDSGTKPFGSYSVGRFDSVSMVNGTLTVDIPLVSYPQRGGSWVLTLACTIGIAAFTRRSTAARVLRNGFGFPAGSRSLTAMISRWSERTVASPGRVTPTRFIPTASIHPTVPTMRWARSGARPTRLWMPRGCVSIRRHS